MRILADENIPQLDEFFAAHGDLHRMPGRAIDRDALGSADVLLVRSVTRVDRALLEGSSVRFVGTCTIGTDHMDLDYLAEAGITWFSAPGCNARGVVDYVLGSLFTLAEIEGADLSTRTYGVVGAGQVGDRLVAALRGLGWRVLVCDPPRAAAEQGDFVSLATLIEECDVISVHTPLIKTGEWPTWHLFDAERLTQLKPNTWLINASRGAVVDNSALRAILRLREDLQAVLDVWEGEPEVDADLADLCLLATPHIAGYSLDGKIRGTEHIYRQFCAFIGQPPTLTLRAALPANPLAGLGLDASAELASTLAMVCRAVYDPRRDDADFRRSLHGDLAQRKAAFDELRKRYPARREIDGLKIRLKGSNTELETALKAIGISVL